MDKNINKLQPTELWGNFYELTKIPRPSKHEEKVIDFVKKFGEGLGLETIVDDIGNVIIRKPAKKGMENKRGVILQSHLDMVPQKNSNKAHDFEKDPIEAYIDGNWVTANETTLGADNGIGAAAMMAVLASKSIDHGPIEALFTIDEETGMTGAFKLKPDLLNGDILLNLDSEDEGEIYIGCAGGIDTTAQFNLIKVKVPDGFEAFKVSVTGLKGGHSGMDINLGRGNANKILNKILLDANEKCRVLLSEIDGGSLRNAIPREAFATIVLPSGNAELLNNLVDTIYASYKTGLSDGNSLKIEVASATLPEYAFEGDALNGIFTAVEQVPNGMIEMNSEFEGVVETSSNLAIIKSDEDMVKVAFLHRSSSDEAKMNLCAEIKQLFEKHGASVEHSGSYPGWQPNPDSAILNTMKKVYQENYGETPATKVIHAGLECGILGATYPNWDMISFGPTIRFPHSPDEKVHVESVGKFWDYLVKTLREIPER